MWWCYIGGVWIKGVRNFFLNFFYLIKGDEIKDVIALIRDLKISTDVDLF